MYKKTLVFELCAFTFGAGSISAGVIDTIDDWIAHHITGNSVLTVDDWTATYVTKKGLTPCQARTFKAWFDAQVYWAQASAAAEHVARLGGYEDRIFRIFENEERAQFTAEKYASRAVQELPQAVKAIEYPKTEQEWQKLSDGTKDYAAQCKEEL